MGRMQLRPLTWRFFRTDGRGIFPEVVQLTCADSRQENASNIDNM